MRGSNDLTSNRPSLQDDPETLSRNLKGSIKK